MNKCMDISRDKLARLHARRPGHDYEKRNLKRETEVLLIAEE